MKTADDRRISDWSSAVGSSYLPRVEPASQRCPPRGGGLLGRGREPCANVPALVQLGQSRLPRVGIPGLDRVAQVASRLQLGELQAGPDLVDTRDRKSTRLNSSH